MTTAAATRRSSRLSGASLSSNDDSAIAPVASSSTTDKQSRRSTATSTRSSGASSAVIPAVAARASKRAAPAGKERRFSEVLGGLGDETRTQDASVGAFEVEAQGPTKVKGKGRTRDKLPSSASSGGDELFLAEEPRSMTAAASKGGWRNGATIVSQPTARPARAPRKTLGEEAEGDFVFQRDAAPAQTSTARGKAANGHGAAAAMAPPAAGASAGRKRRAASPTGSRQPSSSSSSASSRPNSSRAALGRTTYEPLPDEAAGETPIIRRNQAFRAGLEVHPGAGGRTPSSGGRSSAGSRRSSLGLKGERRRSSLRDPAIAAYPHDDVPDHELFRHCPPDTTPQIRMRHLIGWALKRSLAAALGAADPSKRSSASTSSKGKKRKTEEALPTLTDAEKAELKLHEEGVSRITEQLLSDLHCGAFGINWMGENNPAPGGPALQPHPRNKSNTEAKARLAATVESMTSESKQWQKEQWQIEAYEADTAELERQLAAAEGDDVADVTNLPEVDWDEEEDLSEAGQQQLRDARRAMASLQEILSDNGGSGTVEAKAGVTAAKGKGRGRTSKAAVAAAAAAEAEAAAAAAAQVSGSEQDPRWRDIEFNVDLLRSRSHQFAQLQSLASRYVRTVSAQNAQALRDRTSASSSYATAATSRSKRSRPGSREPSAEADDDDDEQPAEGGAERLEGLLSGVRESRSDAAGAGQAAVASGRKRRGDVSGDAEATTITDRFEPDESDAMDLLRALAKS